MRQADRALLRVVEAFMKRHRMADVEFGRAARNDPAFVSRLRRGVVTNMKIAGEIRFFMDNYGKAAPVPVVSAPAVVMSRPVTPSSGQLQERVERDQADLAERLLLLRTGAKPSPSDPVARLEILAGPQTAGEAIRLVQSRWGETWEGIVAAAREQRVPPGALMVKLIEQGLAGLSEAA